MVYFWDECSSVHDSRKDVQAFYYSSAPTALQAYVMNVMFWNTDLNNAVSKINVITAR